MYTILTNCSPVEFDLDFKLFYLLILVVHALSLKNPSDATLLFCQPRVEVTSCFVYKVMELTIHDRIHTQLIYRFELAQVLARDY